MAQTMLEAALAYVSQGFAVFPVQPNKKPLTEHGLKDATQDVSVITAWWQKWPNAGIAIPTQGLVVLDCDLTHDGLKSKGTLEDKHGTLPSTRTHRTGGGGLHLLFRNPNGSDVRNTVALAGYPGLDIRANGGYIVVPPSYHQSGNRYEVLDACEIAFAPGWLVTLTKAQMPAPLPNGSVEQPIPEGQRNQRLFKVASAMRRQGLSQEAIEAALLEVNQRQCQPPLPDNDVAVIAKSGARYKPEDTPLASTGPSKYLPDSDIPLPVVSESIGRVTYLWKDLSLRIVADRITETGIAELWFYRTDTQALMHTTKANLLSTPTMNQIAKRMTGHSTEIPWPQILTYITAQTMEFSRRGEPGSIISPNLETVKHPGYFISPIIMCGVPSVIYGDKGVNKTTLALACLGLVSLGCKQTNFGLYASRQGNAALLDWESTRDLTEYTLGRLISGDTVPYFDLPYLRCRQPLAEDIDRISNFLASNKIELIAIDSLGQAAGGDKYDSAGKASALRFFEALRQLNVTSLIIAQNAKGEDNKKTIYGCYSADTEVLTDSGWKRHADILDNDLIICYDPDAKCLRQDHFTKRWEYDYDGKLLHINHKATEALVTPNHKVLTSNHGEITAEGLNHFINPAYKLPYNTPFKHRGSHHYGRHQKRFRLVPNTKWLDMPAFLQFLGYFISEGSLNRGQTSLTQTEGETLEKMKECLNQLGFPFTEQKTKRKEGWKPCSQLNIAADAGQRNSQFTHSIMKCSRRPKYNQQHLLVTWLKDNCGEGAAHKHLPSLVWALPRRHQQTLLDALIEGDGHLYEAGFSVYTTISKQLADDIQRLSMLIGYGSQIATRQRGNYQLQYELLISKASRKTITINPRRNTEYIPYKGKVFCLTVPTGYYVTRYNGRVAILGNSTFFTYYSRNIFELKGQKDEQHSDEMHIVLLHQEANYSSRHKPLGFCLSYTEDAISIVSEDASSSGILERMSRTSALLDFLKDGAKTRAGIADALEISANQATVILNRAAKRGLVVSLGSGLWGLKLKE